MNDSSNSSVNTRLIWTQIVSEPTRQAAVLGHPISHSLSPLIHNAGINDLGLNAQYSAIDVTEDDLQSFINQLSSDWVGLSLTMPLKSRVLEFISCSDPVVETTGSANTVYRNESGSWQLMNTDVFGLEAAIKSSGFEFDGTAIILGSGATGRSAALALANLGFNRVNVLARNTTDARLVCEILTSHRVASDHLAWGKRGFSEYGLVLSTLPPHAFQWNQGGVTCSENTVLLDVAYSPWPSALASEWPNELIINGIEMLYWQATRQFESFFGQPAPLDAMRRAIQGLQPST